jgi:ribosomal protein L11 methyltransferase
MFGRGHSLRNQKLFGILFNAITDQSFRESLFRNERNLLRSFDLTLAERAYLKWLPYEKFEQMVGGIISHCLVPNVVNDRYLILPESTEDNFPNSYIPIRLTDSLVFGNGGHATTALSLAAMDKFIFPGARVLDLGTGSGILSIAAAMNDAGEVLAYDIDANSMTAATKNVNLNGVEDLVSVELGSLKEAQKASEEKGKFDLVLANILTPVILSFFEAGLIDVVKPGAILVTSGIETRSVRLVKRSARRSGLKYVGVFQKDGWAAVISRKPL